MSTTRTVAKNSLWYGLELGFVMLASMATSVLVARHFGPERLADYSLVLWLTYVAGTLGSVGIPLTTRKYMAEHFGRDEDGIAYRVFRTALQTQVAVAIVVTLVAGVMVWVSTPPDFRPVGLCMVAGIFPRLIGFIPSQANAAAQNTAANVPGSVIGGIVQVAGVMATLLFNWDLLGLALAQMAGHTTEMSIKLWPVIKKAYGRDLPPLTSDLRSRMVRFSSQGLGLVLMNLVIFDRSDLLMLKALDPDKTQITFYSISFGLVDRLLMIPQALSGGISASLMATYGRDRSRAGGMAGLSAVYLMLVGLPVLGGAIAISEPVWGLYGDKYTGAVPVFTTMAVFAMGRLMVGPAQSMLQATENQGFLVWWSAICAALNLTLDFLLIPSLGAVGVAIGNGSGHLLMAAGVWFQLWKKFGLHPHLGRQLKLVISTAVMVVGAKLCTTMLPQLPGVVAAVLAGAIIYLVMLRLTGSLAQQDRDRLLSLGNALPRVARAPFERLVVTLVPSYTS